MIAAGYKPAWIYGGPTYSISALSEALVQYGMDVTVLTTNANGQHDFGYKNYTAKSIAGVKVIYCRRITGDPTSVSFTHSWALWKMIKEYDLVHINGWWNWVAIASLFICKIRHVPHVLSLRGSLSEYTFHTIHTKRIKNILHSFLFKPFLKGTFIHVTSEEEMEKCKRMIPDAKYASIPNIISMPDAQMGIKRDRDELKIIFLGRINPVKNLELLINALRRISFAYKLTIVGDGSHEYLAHIREMINEMPGISILDSRYDEEKYDLLAHSDLLVLLSHTENFGNVVIEALSQGTAVLISKNVGAADFVQQHHLGWVIQPDIECCVEALYKINIDQEQLDAIRERAPGIINKEFSSQTLVNRYVQECYQSVNPKFLRHAKVVADA